VLPIRFSAPVSPEIERIIADGEEIIQPVTIAKIFNRIVRCLF